MIEVNKLRCLICKDVIESRYRWEFVWCKCKAVCLSGGHEYRNIVGNIEDIEVLTK